MISSSKFFDFYVKILIFGNGRMFFKIQIVNQNLFCQLVNFRAIILFGIQEKRCVLVWYLCGYRLLLPRECFFECPPITSTWNILSNVRTYVPKYVVTWFEHSRESNRRYSNHFQQSLVHSCRHLSQIDTSADLALNLATPPDVASVAPQSSNCVAPHLGNSHNITVSEAVGMSVLT